MMPNLKSYSKWFRFLMWLFWPVAVLSLFSYGTSLLAYLSSLLDALYVFLLLFTFIIESIVHIHRGDKKGK